MIMFRKTHEAEVKRLEEKSEVLLKHIENLHDLHYDRIQQYERQIEDLRKLVFPPAPKVVEPIVFEADAVLEGSDKPYQISEEEHNRLMDEARERDLLFSGDY